VKTGFLDRDLVVVAVMAQDRPYASGDGDRGDLSWLTLVRKSVGVADGVEGSAEVVGKGVGGGDDVLADTPGCLLGDRPGRSGRSRGRPAKPVPGWLV
jgi:hypothetical protein